MVSDILYSVGSHPCEDDGGGWGGLWRGRMGTDTVIDYMLIINYHGNRDIFHITSVLKWSD